MYIIGMLFLTEQTIDEIPEVEQELNQLGYAVHLEQMGANVQSPQIGDYYYEKESIIIWLCRCFGDLARCQRAVESFIKADVEMIIATTRPALDIAIQATEEIDIPVVFTHVTQELETAIELKQLQNNRQVTGIWDVWLETSEERLSLLTEIVPPPTTIHAIYNPILPVVKAETDILLKTAQTLNLKLILHDARTLREAKEKLSRLQTHRDHAIIRLADPTTEQAASFMGAIANEQYIPYVGLTIDELDRCGSLFALEVKGAGALIAKIIDRIIKGESPSNIPFAVPSRKTLGVNMQVAHDLGLIVSPAVLSRAQITIPSQESAQLGTQFLSLLTTSLLLLGLILLITQSLTLTYILAIIFGVTIILFLWMWIFLNRKVIGPIRKLAIAAEKIGSGELSTPITDLIVKNEVDTLTRALRRMRNNLKSSYAELDQLNLSLKQQVTELTHAYQTLEKTQRDLELASRRIIHSEDVQRFALTTYIHDEIIGPLDDLLGTAQELNHHDLIRLSHKLEHRIRQLRFDLSTPILQDIVLELNRLIQETLPSIYSKASQINIVMDVSELERNPTGDPAYNILLYRFVRGAVSNVYRHSHATRVDISANIKGKEFSLCVFDNGQGFDPDQIGQYVEAGHYFFHDIQIRARQLLGDFLINSAPGKGTSLEISLPLTARMKNSIKTTTHQQNNKD